MPSTRCSIIFTMEEADLVLVVLALIDISLVGSLIVMVMFSGYENFVSRIDTGERHRQAQLARQARLRHAETEGRRLDRRDLFDSPAARVSWKPRRHRNDKIMWYVILHMTFVFSAVLLGVLDKMSFAAHSRTRTRTTTRATSST